MLEHLAAATWAEIVSAEFFFQQLIAVNNADAPLYHRFGRKTATPLTHGLERNVPRVDRNLGSA
jgi:hypothetical protein